MDLPDNVSVRETSDGLVHYVHEVLRHVGGALYLRRCDEIALLEMSGDCRRVITCLRCLGLGPAF